MLVERIALRSLVRACSAAAIGTLDRTAATEVARREFSNDRAAEWLVRAPSLITDTASAPPLVHLMLPDLLATLAPSSAAARLFQEGLQLKFDHAGQIAVPTILGNTAYSAWVAEGKPIPVVAGQFEPLTFLNPRKLTTIVVLTSEMVRSSNLETLMTDALIRSTGMALDGALLDDQPGDDARPAGLRYGVTPLAASTAPDPTAALMQDIESCRRAVGDVTATHPVYVMSATRALMAELRSTHGLKPLIVLGSHALKGTMIMLAVTPENLVSVGGGGTPEISTSREAALAMMTNPAADELTTKSMFQTDCVAIVIRLPVTWGVRSPLGVSWLVTTNW